MRALIKPVRDLLRFIINSMFAVGVVSWVWVILGWSFDGPGFGGWAMCSALSIIFFTQRRA